VRPVKETVVKKILSVVTASIFAVALSTGAYAQDHRDDHHDDHAAVHDDHHNDHYVRHDDWHKGYHMAPNDWNRGDRLDYRQYHLAAPPRGYEWRRVDGNYVMAAVATGIVASLVAASAVH
jgi:Ni/Co efflux regulator RcnB